MKFLARLNVWKLASKSGGEPLEKLKDSSFAESRSSNLERGDSGEHLAYRFLRRNGYKIVARKYKKKFGEIDLIGWDKDILAFIEVKSRSHLERGRPEEAVNRHKQNQICRVAKEYRNHFKLHDINYRFDIVGIHGSKENPCLYLIKDAFKEGF
jgi:putative endonuclease